MNIKEEMPNYYKILERMENSTHSILDYVIASAFDECTYDELERAAAERARITAENETLKFLLLRCQQMNYTADGENAALWNINGEFEKVIAAALNE